MSTANADVARKKTRGLQQPEQGMLRGWVFPAAFLAVCLAYLPVLLVYLPQLWTREYYRFFPFAFVATFVLAVVRADRTQQLEASRTRWVVRIAAFVLAEVLVGVGIWSGSPWPCFVGFVATLGLLLDCWSDSESDRTLLYLILPMVLVIRPPLHLDEKMVQDLQTLTSQQSSVFLTGMNIHHLLSGNVIEPFGGAPLMVEEACSGVQSLFTLMFLAAVISIYRRYTLLRSGLLMASSVVWALLMNMFRVLMIVVAQTKYAIDLSTGWQHEVIGYIGILLALTLLLSSDRLLAFLVGGITDEPLKYPRLNPFVAVWNWLFVAPPVTGIVKSSTYYGSGSYTAPDVVNALTERRTTLTTRSAFVFASVWLFAALSITPAWGLPGLGHSAERVAVIAQLQDVDASWLGVDKLPNCSLKEFTVTKRAAESQFGQYSDEWYVDTPFGTVLHSMDHVFDAWHNLTVCYEGIGWNLTRFEERTPEGSDASWPVAYAEFTKQTGERAYLCFSLFTTDGQPILPEGETSGLAGLERRLRQSRMTGRPVVQVQTLTASPLGLNEPAIQYLADAHAMTRQQLRERVMQATGSNTRVPAAAQTSTAGGGE